MPPPPLLSSIAPIADRYDALLCDAWGVLHDGVDVFPGAAEALTRFRAERGPVVILTNAPRPSMIIPPQLDRLGFPREAYDAVVTSGDATRAAIAARLPAPAFRIGPAKDDALYVGIDVAFVPLADASFVVCSGLGDDMRETPEDYRDVLKDAARRGLPMICANPDVVVRWGGRLIFCAGALAEIYHKLGGAVIYGGKPHPPIYALALRKIAEIAGIGPPKARVLAIGDGLMTDILGANREGIDAIYVAGAGGVHEGAATEAEIGAALGKAGVHAIAAMESLQW